MEPLGLVPFFPVAEQAWDRVRGLPAKDSLVAIFSLPLLLFEKGALDLAPRLPGVSFPRPKAVKKWRHRRPRRPVFALAWNRGHPSFIRSFEGWSLSPEQGLYSYDFVTFILVIIAVLTGFYISTWIGSQLVLAVKGIIEIAVLAVSLGGLAFFTGGIARATHDKDPVFVFVTDIDGRALSTGVVVFAFLVMGQLFVFTGLPVGWAGVPVSYSLFEIAGLLALLTWLLGPPSPLGHAKAKAYATGGYLLAALMLTVYLLNSGVAYLIPGVSSTNVGVASAYSVGPLTNILVQAIAPAQTYTIQTNAQLVGLFYTEAAITESFFFQGLEYGMLVAGLTGFDPRQMTWKKHAVASFIVVASAGILHESVYQLSVITIVAVAVGFAIINLAFQITLAINTAIIAHILLNVVSTLSGSAVSFTPGTLAIAALAVGIPMLAVGGPPLGAFVRAKLAPAYISRTPRFAPLSVPGGRG